MGQWLGAWVLEPHRLVLNPSSTIYKPLDFRQITQLSCASGVSSCEMGGSPNLTEWLRGLN